ncbi:hypothetical protein V7S43_014623 [Phytophthora oleae]|uniref:Uncharacterized protein n=1 Tax=Phytophthora oleae TaxID=2107226 RepID=A0ABD3F4W6_9STRA
MAATSATRLAPRAPKKKKKNATAKRLRPQQGEGGCAGCTGSVEARTEAAEAVPDAVRAAETVTVAIEAVPVAAEATEAVTEPSAETSEAVAAVPVTTKVVPVVAATVPVTARNNATCASVAKKKKKARKKIQLAPIIRALEEDEEEYRSFVASSQANVTEVGGSSGISIGRTNATVPTHSDTDYASSGANEDSDDSSDSEMYWRIYYERSQLTVTANFASTKERWQVDRINDRRGNSLLKFQYQVLWANPLVKRRRYYQRTWEPCAQLLDDDSRQEIELVDRWKASKIKTFAAFWPTDEYGKNAIGTDMQGLCVFNALRRAAELSGHPGIVTQRDIDDFVADQTLIARFERKRRSLVRKTYIENEAAEDNTFN